MINVIILFGTWPSYLTGFLDVMLTGVVAARNYVSSSFLQWSFIMARTQTQELLI